MTVILGVILSVIFSVFGIAIGGYLEWRTHRYHCGCVSCKEWRSDLLLHLQEEISKLDPK